MTLDQEIAHVKHQIELLQEELRTLEACKAEEETAA